jgi:phage baseplate assembly protein W
MPLERVSQGFKDISMSFQSNPLNDDIIAIKNATAIARSVRNIVFTLPGEKFFDPNFGSNISASLFENIDPFSASIIESEIRTSINNFEPRVNLQDVSIEPDYDNNTFNATIRYEIIGANIPPQQLEFVLLSSR